MNSSNKKELGLNFLLMVFSIIGGYLFYYFISMDVIIRIYHNLNNASGIFIYACHIFFFFWILKVMFKLKITKWEQKIAAILYGILMYLAFFDRFDLGRREFNINPLDFLTTQSIMTVILNIVIFLPFFTILKWLFNNNSNKNNFLIWIFISIFIETLQYITMRGIFDIADIVLYLVGYLIGIKLYEFFFKN